MRKTWIVVSAGLAAAVTGALLATAPRLQRARVAAGPPATVPSLSPKPLLLPAPTQPPPPPSQVRSPAGKATRQGPYDLGVEDGVAGGVPGGVLGGVAGGVVGGLPDAPGFAARESPFLRERPRRVAGAFNTEAYDRIRDNPFLAARTNPLSTFSIDVDTASYANVRRFLEGGQLPPKDAVRVEELVNYFRFDYPPPEGGAPFSVTTEVFDCPWKPEHRLALIGLQGQVIDEAQVPSRNLVFLLDVSGSMHDPRKLPLVKAAMGLLVDRLRPQDTVSIVAYAGSEGLALPPTPGRRKEEIREAIDRLEAGGTTAGGAGIMLAYRVASETFVPGGINRVLLATDGDFNVGVTSQGELVRLIEEKRKSGVFLSVLGFGMGNLKDSTMEKLAQYGNGNYAYIDSLFEARKVLVEEAGATLVTIAKDVKIQVEFNPARVAAYRLVGYENRVMAAEDFNDDTKDAGEIGAGHTVTALYEVVPAGTALALPAVDPLKYQRATAAGAASDELLTVKLRYKEPEGEESRLLSVPVADDRDHRPTADARFAAAVAGFGMLLRDSEHKGAATWARVLELAEGARGEDREGYRAQFLELVKTASALAASRQASAVRLR